MDVRWGFLVSLVGELDVGTKVFDVGLGWGGGGGCWLYEGGILEGDFARFIIIIVIG